VLGRRLPQAAENGFPGRFAAVIRDQETLLVIGLA